MSTPSMYDTPHGVDAYVKMADGCDGLHVARLNEMLAPGSDVPELGTGPGVDLDMLAETFTVVGSDTSQAFLDRYVRMRPDIDRVQLDAITVDTDRRFDAVYSNKVLHHLTRDELSAAAVRDDPPRRALRHALSARTRRHLVPETLDIVECTFCAEMDTDDSVRVVLRPSAGGRRRLRCAASSA